MTDQERLDEIREYCVDGAGLRDVDAVFLLRLFDEAQARIAELEGALSAIVEIKDTEWPDRIFVAQDMATKALAGSKREVKSCVTQRA